ncbi:UrvD/REP family ATP-dependent DNA helicase [Gryllotalpicola sp.]|uniref:UrvD/REP family ATP-dependent DNA helicase n=1 Tax=Gryllotalpicola sp. TaxID=1932787 RepID=UPI0026290E89|nr:UrvD/REP family ATP-dependent DNA helicase [Gryllotalpicola sp.]
MADPVVLDASQRAVLGLEPGRSALVLGAPGTGKTTTLIEFVASRVAAGIPADRVLALSATRPGATRLRDRLALRLGVTAQGPRSRTATSLAFQLVAQQAIAVGAPKPRLLTGAEQDAILAAILDGRDDDADAAWPAHLGPEVRRLPGFRAELRELMDRMVDLRLGVAEVAALGRAHGEPAWVAAAAVIAEHVDVASAMRPEFRTAAELLVESAGLVVSRAVDPGLDVIAVDDAQEVTRGAATLLRALAATGVAVVVFGDPDVATATFRGGEPEFLGDFERRIGMPAPRFVLGVAHRHGPALRDLAARVTAGIGTARGGMQRAAVAGRADADDSVAVVSAPSTSAQYAAVAWELRRQHLVAGVGWGDMAVVVRSGAQASAITRALAASEIPVRTQVAARALRDDYAAHQLLVAVRAALDPRRLDAEVARELLSGPLGGLDRVQLRRLRIALRQEEIKSGGSRSSDDLLVDALSGPGRLATIDNALVGRARRLADELERVRSLAGAGATIEELLWSVWDSSGLADVWGRDSRAGGILAEEADRNLDGVVALFTAAKRFVERDEHRPVADFFAEVLDSAVPEDTLARQGLAEAVYVTTPAGVVGAEFEVVVVAMVHDGVWPNIRLRGSLLGAQRLVETVTGVSEAAIDERKLVIDDEARMFALAVSRARKRVVVAATASEDEQPSAFHRFARGAELAVPDFALTLRGLTGDLRRRLTSQSTSAAAKADAAAALALLARQGAQGASPDEWYGLAEPTSTAPLARPGEQVRVSPSKIESVEESPLHWFIDQMSATSGGPEAAIGTIVHKVFEEIAREDSPDISAERIVADVDTRWSELVFESSWLGERAHRRAERIAAGLHAFLADETSAGLTPIEAEGRFTLDLGPAVLSGSIDRVERTPDGAVIVVDLKTSASARAAPASGAIGEHAQLSAYQLALGEGAFGDGIGPSAGAKLVFVALDGKARPYREAAQPPLDDEAIARFRERVLNAAELMGRATFVGKVFDERHYKSGYSSRIHFIAAVSA